MDTGRENRQRRAVKPSRRLRESQDLKIISLKNLMCTTELYSSDKSPTKAPPLPVAPAIAPPKKRARNWNHSIPSDGPAQPLQEENGRRRQNVVTSVVVDKEKSSAISQRTTPDPESTPAPLDLSQALGSSRNRRNQQLKVKQEGQSFGAAWRKRRRSSSATDSASSKSLSPVTTDDVFPEKQPPPPPPLPSSPSTTTCSTSVPNSHLYRTPSMSNLNQQTVYSPMDVAGVSATTRSAEGLHPSDPWTMRTNGLHHGNSESLLRLGGNIPAIKEEVKMEWNNPHASNPNKSIAGGSGHLSSSNTTTTSLSQPFTQGKVKQKWAQRMLVEQEELALEENNKLSLLNSASHGVPALGDDGSRGRHVLLQPKPHLPSNHHALASNEVKNELYPPPRLATSTTTLHAQDMKPMGVSSLSLSRLGGLSAPPPPPSISTTAFPSTPQQCVEYHGTQTLYKALTSELSPPRQRHSPKVARAPAPSMQSSQDTKLFKPIATCGKKIVDHIVEQLIRSDNTNNTTTNDGSSTALLRASLFPPGIANYSRDEKPFVEDWKKKEASWLSCSESSGGFGQAGWLKEERDSFPGVFAASSLVERVAKQVCGLQAAKKETISPRQCFTQNAYGRMVPTNQSVVKMEGKNAADESNQYAENDRSDMSPVPETPEEDGNFLSSFLPVRKSRRANRGQKYEALIKEGIIQPSKARLANRNTAKTTQGQSSHSDNMYTTARMSPSSLSTNPGSTSSLAGPPNTTTKMMEKKRRRVTSEGEVVTTTSIRESTGFSSSSSSSSSSVSRREQRGIVVTADTQTSATYHLSVSESGCRTIHIPLPKNELPSDGLTGSRKRKARRHRITHISVLPSDGERAARQSPTPATTRRSNTRHRRDSPLTVGVARNAETANLPSSQYGRPPTHSGSRRRRREEATKRDRGMVDKRDHGMVDKRDHGMDKPSLTALNLLTCAAVASEKAPFPSWPQEGCKVKVKTQTQTLPVVSPSPHQHRRGGPVAKSSPVPATKQTLVTNNGRGAAVANLTDSMMMTSSTSRPPACVPKEGAQQQQTNNLSPHHHPASPSTTVARQPAHHQGSRTSSSIFAPTTLVTPTASCSRLLQSMSMSTIRTPPGGVTNFQPPSTSSHWGQLKQNSNHIMTTAINPTNPLSLSASSSSPIASTTRPCGESKRTPPPHTSTDMPVSSTSGSPSGGSHFTQARKNNNDNRFSRKKVSPDNSRMINPTASPSVPHMETVLRIPVIPSRDRAAPQPLQPLPSHQSVFEGRRGGQQETNANPTTNPTSIVRSKDALFQHSQKLVKLLLKKDVATPTMGATTTTGGAAAAVTATTSASVGGSGMKTVPPPPPPHLSHHLPFNNNNSAAAAYNTGGAGLGKGRGDVTTARNNHNNNNNHTQQQATDSSTPHPTAATTTASSLGKKKSGGRTPGTTTTTAGRRKPSKVVSSGPTVTPPIVKGLPVMAPGVKLFPPPTTSNPHLPPTSSDGKRKPTIWDHLSWQCPVPLKSAAPQSKTPASCPSLSTAMQTSTMMVDHHHQHQQQSVIKPSSSSSNPQKPLVVEALSSMPKPLPLPSTHNHNAVTIRPTRHDDGSDTDSADEVTSDTDSADESETPTTTRGRVGIGATLTTSPASLMAGRLLAATLPSAISLSTPSPSSPFLLSQPVIGSLRLPQQSPSSHPHQSPSHPQPSPSPHHPLTQQQQTVSKPTPTTPNATTPLLSRQIVVGGPHPHHPHIQPLPLSLPVSYVAVSSITLPADIPDSEDLLPLKPSVMTSPCSPPLSPPRLVIQHSLPPISPPFQLPAPHVTDLSSTPATPGGEIIHQPSSTTSSSATRLVLAAAGLHGGRNPPTTHLPRPPPSSSSFGQTEPPSHPPPSPSVAVGLS